MHAFFITNNLQITDVSARRHGQMFSDMRLMCCYSSGFRIVFHLVWKFEEKSLLNSKTLVKLKVACKNEQIINRDLQIQRNLFVYREYCLYNCRDLFKLSCHNKPTEFTAAKKIMLFYDSCSGLF